MAKIIVAGHVCLDITPVFSAEKVLPLSKDHGSGQAEHR